MKKKGFINYMATPWGVFLIILFILGAIIKLADVSNLIQRPLDRLFITREIPTKLQKGKEIFIEDPPQSGIIRRATIQKVDDSKVIVSVMTAQGVTEEKTIQKEDIKALPQVTPWARWTFLALLIGFLVFFFSYLSKSKQLKNKTTISDMASQSIHKVLKGQFGFNVGKFRKIVNINMDGSCSITVQRQNIVATTQRILHFPHRIEKLPEAKVSSLELDTSRYPKNPTRSVDLLPRYRGEREYRFFVHLTGGLAPKAKDEQPQLLSYDFKYSLSKAFIMTKEEADKTYRNSLFRDEYSMVGISCPIDVAELEVEFPERYLVKPPFLAVFVGLAEDINVRETNERVKQHCLTPIEDNKFRLEVKQPIIGFRYAIAWTPRLTKDYKELKG